MPGLSNWREEFNLSEVVTGKMTDKEALRKVSEKSGIKNKVTINPKLDEAVKEIGGEVISMVEADTTAQKQRLDMKQMILDRQKLKLRRKDMSAAKQEKKQGVEGESTGALKQGNVIAAEETMKNCGCGQDPCITYGTENEKKRKNALQIQKVIGEEEVDECWKTHKKVGMKMKGGKMVPDCRPKNEEVEIGEGVMKMVKRVMSKKKTEKKPEKAMDAGAIARRKLQQKDHETVNFLPMDEARGPQFAVIPRSPKKQKEYDDRLKKWLGDMKPSKPKKVNEAKVDKGRSDYGKASIRNYRRSGPGHGEPAMFDPENKRGKLIDKRREEHKARRGVKGAKVPAYKVSEGEDKAFNFVVNKLKKKYGDGVLTTGEKRKPQSDAEKAKVRAQQAKIDKENASARAKDPSQGRYSRPY